MPTLAKDELLNQKLEPLAKPYEEVVTKSNRMKKLTHPMDRKSTLLDETKRTAYFAFTCFIAVWYIFFYGMQTILIKFINDHFQVFLVWYTALLMSAGWIINLIIFTFLGGWSDFNLRDVLYKYGPLSVVTFSNAAFSAYGLNYLPGSVYVLLKGTSIVFNVILSKLILRKQMNSWHWFSVLIMAGAVVSIAFEPQSSATDFLPQFYVIGFVLTLASSLSRALQAILSSWWFKKTKKTMKTVVETTLFNGIFTNILLIPAIFISGEYKQWPVEFNRVSEISSTSLMTFVLLSVFTALAKQLEYLAKFAVVARVSALFEAVMDIFRRIIVIVIIVILFHEGFTVEKLISIILVVFGFLAYMQAGRVALKEKERAAAKAEETLEQKLLDTHNVHATVDSLATSPRNRTDSKRYSFNVESSEGHFTPKTGSFTNSVNVSVHSYKEKVFGRPSLKVRD